MWHVLHPPCRAYELPSSTVATYPPPPLCTPLLVVVQTLCPNATYNTLQNQSSNASCLGCVAGYYCPVGSPALIECVSANTYCPANSSAPLPVPVGYYSQPLPLHIYAQPCPPGSFCLGGVKAPCAENRTSLAFNMTSCPYVTCQGPGYWNGSSSGAPMCLRCGEVWNGTAAVVEDVPQNYTCTSQLFQANLTVVDVFNVTYTATTPYYVTTRLRAPLGYYTIGYACVGVPPRGFGMMGSPACRP